MREVGKTEFFRDVVGNKNVHPRIVGNYPYKSEYKTPMGNVVGVSERHIPEGKALPETRYYAQD